jgi:hypothetical protein
VTGLRDYAVMAGILLGTYAVVALFAGVMLAVCEVIR